MNLFSRVLLFGGVLFMSLACSKSDTTLTSVQFSETTKSVDESAGTISVTLSLGSAATQDLILAFSVGGTAVKNGDYILNTTTDSTLTITKGSTSATISLQVIDDKAIEDDKTIDLTLTSVSSSGTLGSTTTSLTNTITIQDNDTEPTDAFQFDLLWDAGSLVDMDLYLLSDVVFNSDSTQITESVTYDASENTTGFESVQLSESAPDGTYLLFLQYASGSRDVTCTGQVNGLGYNTSFPVGTIPVAYVNSGAFLIINKSGDELSRSIHNHTLKINSKQLKKAGLVGLKQ
ncbi:Calx-beta domain-containing protein [Cytophagaceae bacterium YF14B1]|uniref:Calx-beta domain-containing protein n=1 Tax=Xanthocytophaga flava TaxID=3048013 RepID=A0AAE3U4W0_9BACT|nr:Calx-beta domain-containing protein [Xanthocytophaga flavus]MDJ1478892.1 Calx-beta domain-containing protein [Xanthocytophaga flavus]